MLEESALLIFAAGAVTAGFVAGLTGLGTALTALAFWLHVTTPQVAVPIAAAVAVTSHIVTLTFIRQGIFWPRLWPFLVGGLIGLPLGVWLLNFLSTEAAKLGLGVFLILYCSYGLSVKTPPVVAAGGRVLDGAAGSLGGVLGGLAGVSGPVPTIWCGLRGWPKDEQRGVFQPFNLVILLLSVVGHAGNGRYIEIDWQTIVMALVLGALGSVAGILVYRRTSDKNFRRIVLSLLLIGGITHIAAAIA
ncbi:MAG: sulfite exporter TauE/SafE family protein [Alphaproteobacteria bacterium]